LGAELANRSPLPGAIKAGVPLAVERITNQLPTSIYDARQGRKSGGRVSDRLVAAVDRAKKNINNQTQTLLRTPDNHVAQALEIANRNLES